MTIVNGTKAGSVIPLIIGGKEIVTKTTFDVISPATGKLLHKCSSASVVDAKDAVQAAQDAFPAWSSLPPARRRTIFLKAADIMEARTEELVSYVVAETGSTAFWASGVNMPLGSDILRDVACRVSAIAGSIPTTKEPGTSALILQEPYGVILAIAPWNAPYILGIRSIAYALAAGNTAVLKAPEFSPRCTWAIASVLAEAGLPPGVLNVIAHQSSDAAAVTTALIENPLVKKVNFTGSTAVGRIIGSLCGKNLKPVLLELGGKAPAIIWNDADLKAAAHECALGSFLHSGQICMSTERVIVHKDVTSAFAAEFSAAVASLFPSSEDAGVLINGAAVSKNKNLIMDAVAKGATILYGDINATESSDTRMRPMIIKGVKSPMDLYYTESFGPTVSLVEVENEEQAISIANDTEYGLTSAVFTSDLRRGLRFAKAIESGAVHINGTSIHDETALPHGGVKSSGFGRFGSTGMAEWLRSKTVTFKN